MADVILSILLVAVGWQLSFGQVQLQEHLKPLASYPPLHGITAMDSFPTSQYFYEWYVKPGQPVLFKSVLNDPDFKYPAYKLWTDDYLSQTHGSHLATFEYKKKETRDPNDSSMMKLRKFLRTYRHDDIYLVMNPADIPRMLDEVSLPPCLRCGGSRRLMSLYHVWFSSGGTRSVLHSDSMDNINCLLDGSKDIIFYDKKHKDLIEVDGFDHARGYSTVDVDRVDLDKFPKFKSLPWIKAHMDKGDCLYIPNSWYHQVNSHGNRNMAVNVWWEHPLWFNVSDCQPDLTVSGPSIPLSEVPTGNTGEITRVHLFAPLKDLHYIYEKNLQAVLEADSKSKTSELFAYLDTDQDGVVSWEEIHQADMQELLNKFGQLIDQTLLDTDDLPSADSHDDSSSKEEL